MLLQWIRDQMDDKSTKVLSPHVFELTVPPKSESWGSKLGSKNRNTNQYKVHGHGHDY
jgi:hypothetical protein